MASCPKCGKPRIAKPQGRLRACKRCGTLPTCFGLLRNGMEPLPHYMNPEPAQ